MKPIAFAIIFVSLAAYDLIATHLRGDDYKGEWSVSLMAVVALAGVTFS